MRLGTVLPQSLGNIGEKRFSLYALIAGSPGLHFRELQRRTKMANGQLKYHLGWLKDHSVIRTIADGQYLRFYTLEKIGANERTVLELSRQRSIRHILLHLLENGRDNHENIVNKLDLSPSTISWHLKKMVNAGILAKEVDGRKSYFSLCDPETVKGTLVKYRESFLDRMVDRFIEMWDE